MNFIAYKQKIPCSDRRQWPFCPLLLQKLHWWIHMPGSSDHHAPPPGTRDIHSFILVAEEQNFRRAAERLHVDQSALTRRIQNLETKLGYLLFTRTTREVTLTEAGQVLFERSRHILQNLQQATEIARLAANGKTGRIRVGYMSFAANRILPEAIRKFTARYPDVIVEPRYLNTQAQKVALSRNEIDAGFLLGPFDHTQFRSAEVSSEKLVALVSAKHTLAGRQSVTIREIAAQPLVLGTVGEWDAFRTLIRDLFSGEGITLADAIRYEAPDTNGILGMVASGLGVTLYSGGIRGFEPRSITCLPIRDSALSIGTVLCWNKSRLTPQTEGFISMARDFSS
jgi:DNA-binding transcriptional LysR family regulator